jgi:hypothetical protein
MKFLFLRSARMTLLTVGRNRRKIHLIAAIQVKSFPVD